MTLTLTPKAAQDGAGNTINGGVDLNDFSGVGTGPFSTVSVLVDSTQNEILGTTVGTAITSDINGTVQGYLRGLVKMISGSISGLALGSAIPGGSAPVTMAPPLLGAYRMAPTSGVMAAGLVSGSPIFSLRYGGTGYALVRKVILSAGNTSTAFTAGVCTFQLFAARSFTANDSGGTAVTLTGNNGKLRTGYETSNLSDLRISSTGTLTAGTRTLDSVALGSKTASVPATAGNDVLASVFLFERQSPDEQPIILQQNEGIVIEATVPATGTWTFSVEVQWDECATY